MCGPERRDDLATIHLGGPLAASPHVLERSRARSIASRLSTLAERPPFLLVTCVLFFFFFARAKKKKKSTQVTNRKGGRSANVERRDAIERARDLSNTWGEAARGPPRCIVARSSRRSGPHMEQKNKTFFGSKCLFFPALTRIIESSQSKQIQLSQWH